MLAVTAPANAIYRVQIKGIDGVSKSTPSEVHGLWEIAFG